MLPGRPSLGLDTMGPGSDPVGQRRLRSWPASKLHDAKLEADIVAALVEARQQMGLPMYGVAKQLNVSKTTIYYWEKGITFPDRLSKLIEWGRVVGRNISVEVEVMRKSFAIILLGLGCLGLAGCGPGISTIIDSTLTTGEEGMEAYSKRKAEALSKAPCHIDHIGMATLSSTKQFAIRMLCQSEQSGIPMTMPQ